jgi:hypothetical protein
MGRFANPLRRAGTTPSGGFFAMPSTLASASIPSGGILPSPITPVHYVPLSPRERRAQAVHRLQVGLFGLAGMLLLVGLANIIMDRAQLADQTTAALNGLAPKSVASSASAANDPLVDMGVVPELPVGKAGTATDGSAGAAARAPAAVVVPSAAPVRR